MAAVTTTRRRVVVTGIGAITPLGNSFQSSWKALLLQQSGVTSLTEALAWQGLSPEALAGELEEAATLACQVAAPVRWKSEEDGRTARFVQLALLAGKEAVEQAGLEDWLTTKSVDVHNSYEHHQPHRCGVCLGSGMSSVREIRQALDTMKNRGHRRISPHFVPKVLANAAAGRLAMTYNLQGPNQAPATACAAGSHAIGDAYRLIQHNQANLMLAGGAESCIDPLSLAGFGRLRALSTSRNNDPTRASRPFDTSRDGFVMGEGAAVLVLEELECALHRGAPTIWAEVVGYGMSCDAHHVTAPHPQGQGALQAMRLAMMMDEGASSNMASSACSSHAMDYYVNAHATSTPLGDEIEARVIDQVLCSSSSSLLSQRTTDTCYVSSTKGATGHLLGAAGAIEAAFTIQSLVEQQIPPTLNLEQPDDEKVGFTHVTETLACPNLRTAMSNSFGFGGVNAALVFRRYED